MCHQHRGTGACVAPPRPLEPVWETWWVQKRGLESGSQSGSWPCLTLGTHFHLTF